jgi:Ca2+-binding EF-hand superfamily protein
MDVAALLQNEAEFKKLCKSIFDQFDTDHNGLIDMKEFKEALTKFAVTSGAPAPDDTVILETMKTLDKDGTKTLDTDEFEIFVKQILLR